MALYYQIYADSESKHTHAFAESANYEPYHLNSCQRVSQWDENQVFRIVNEMHPAKSCEDVPWLFPWHGETLASQRLCDLIRKTDPDCAEFLPVRCRYDPQCDMEDKYYRMINWLYLVDATDNEKSEVRKDSKFGYEYMHNLVIDWSLMPPDKLVFRLKHNPAALYCGKRFIDLLDNNSITGMFRQRVN